MTVDIDIHFVGTEPFYNNYGHSKLKSMKNYAQDIWEIYIEDGSGNYDATFQQLGPNTMEISSGALCTSCDDLWDRAEDADSYLSGHHAGYSSVHVFGVADYMGDPNNQYHWGVAQETAGTYGNKVALVDVAQIESTSGEWSYVGSEGVIAHEVLHMFMDKPTGEEHQPDIDSFDQASLMWDDDDRTTCSGESRAPQALLSKMCPPASRATYVSGLIIVADSNRRPFSVFDSYGTALHPNRILYLCSGSRRVSGWRVRQSNINCGVSTARTQ